MVERKIGASAFNGIAGHARDLSQFHTNLIQSLEVKFPMLTSKQLAGVIGVFGLAVVAGGVIRGFFSADPSTNGLYFGLVLGGMALVGAVLAAVNQIWAARIVTALAVAVVVLWFGFDMYKDLSGGAKFTSAEVRKSITIVLGVATAVAICLPIRK